MGSRTRAPLLLKAGAAHALTLALLMYVPCFAAAKPESSFESLLHRGFAFHNQADYAHALPLLREARTLRPHDYFANLLLGIDVLRAGKPAEAIVFLKEASRQKPGEDLPYDYLGEAQAVLGQYAEAADAHARALEADPASAEAIESSVDFWVERFRQMSVTLRGSNQGLAAAHRLQASSYPPADGKREDLLVRAAELDPVGTGAWSELAFANLASGHIAEAQGNLERALHDNPDDLRALEVHALLAAHAGGWDAALRDLRTVGDRSPGTLALDVEDWPQVLQPPAEMKVGMEGDSMQRAFLNCVAKGCTPEELSHALPPATKVSPSALGALYREQRWERLTALPEPGKEDAKAWFGRGVALAELRRCAEAGPALERALLDRRTPPYAQFLLCRCYARQAGEATAGLGKTSGDEAIAHLVRGDVLLRMQTNSAAALTEYQAALAAHPEDPKLLERIAEAQAGSGEPDAAEESARAALRLDPHRFAAMHTLARIAMDQRRYDAALPYLEQLAAQQPQDAATQVDLGAALAQTGNAAAALEHLSPALAGGYPDEKGSLHALLGNVLRRLGRSEEAGQAFATARDLSEKYQRTAHRGADDHK